MAVCFVCTGNICRSPMADVVLRHLASATPVADGSMLADHLVVSSAGTSGWHVGGPMDPRAQAALQRRGYVDHGHVARSFSTVWFASTDLVVCLDRGHQQTLLSLARGQDSAASVGGPGPGTPPGRSMRTTRWRRTWPHDRDRRSRGVGGPPGPGGPWARRRATRWSLHWTRPGGRPASSRRPPGWPTPGGAAPRRPSASGRCCRCRRSRQPPGLRPTRWSLCCRDRSPRHSAPVDPTAGAAPGDRAATAPVRCPGERRGTAAAVRTARPGGTDERSAAPPADGSRGQAA